MVKGITNRLSPLTVTSPQHRARLEAIQSHIEQAGGGGLGSADKVPGGTYVALNGKGALLRQLWDDTIAGAEPPMSKDQMMSLQAFALDLAMAVFTNEFNSDGDVRHQVGLKQPHYSGRAPDTKHAEAIYGGKPTKTQQAEVLSFILRTFNSDGDQGLRMAALNKLGDVGRQRDVDAVLPHVRKGTSADLYHGIQSLKAITARTGSPQRRGGLHADKEIGPLLKKQHLDHDEWSTAVEAILSRGEIAEAKLKGGGSNQNEVWFITFKEKLPGSDGKWHNVRGVFKPEKTWPGKDRAYFSREVATYDFDRAFAKTGTVPPTVEAIIPLGHTKTCDVGSMQYMIPNSEPLGWNLPKRHYNPKFDAFRNSASFTAQIAKIKTLLFIMADPDKLENNVHPHPNLENLMIDDQQKVWMIDNSYNLGAAPIVDEGILPKDPDATTTHNLQKAPHDQVRSLMGQYINDGDASGAVFRTGVAGGKLGDLLGGN